MSAPEKPAYQPDEASAKAGAAGLLSVFLLALCACGIVFAMYTVFDARTLRPPATPLQKAELRPSGPQLESDPLRDRLALEAPARARLASYGWSDRSRGLAHIPIERAMALQAQRGWRQPEPPQR